ncbi:MAG: hypothetical protein FWE33_02505 [Defluviitaleaceae bacterium]|nr:hypothetical protein [Defluviitaleaceae bacterium]
MLKKPKFWVFCTVLAGVLFGALRPSFLPAEAMDELLVNLNNFSVFFNANEVDAGSLLSSLFRHCYIFILIWACSFLPKFFAVTYLLLYLRAMTAAFSAAMMIWAFGGGGVLTAIVLVLPQNSLVIFVAMYTICIIFERQRKKMMRAVVFGAVAVVIATFYETFIAPMLFTFLNIGV